MPKTPQSTEFSLRSEAHILYHSTEWVSRTDETRQRYASLTLAAQDPVWVPETPSPRMRSVHVPAAMAPATCARSNTPRSDVLDARTTPARSTRCRSTSLWISGCPTGGSPRYSGHQRAPSRVSAPARVISSGTSHVCPFATSTLPHHTRQVVAASATGPAPLVLSKGYGCCPERMTWA